MKKKSEETRGGRGQRHFGGCGDADGGILCSAVRQSASFGGAAGNAAGPGAGSAGGGTGAGAVASGGHGTGEVTSADPGACLSPGGILCRRRLFGRLPHGGPVFVRRLGGRNLPLRSGHHGGIRVYQGNLGNRGGEGLPSERAGANAVSKGLHHAGSQRAGLAANRGVSGVVRQGGGPGPAGPPRHYGGGAVHFARQRRSEGQGQLKRIACI